MNLIKEEHRLSLHDQMSYHDSFTGLWALIASQHSFLRLRFSSDCPTKEEIDSAVEHKFGSMSPYSPKAFDAYTIIYRKKGVVLLTNTPSSGIGTFFAVEDADNPNRYFVAFAFPVGIMTESVTGLVLYMDSRGVSLEDNISLCRKVIFTYDVRNGLIRGEQTHFYHQSLVFHQIHREKDILLFHLNHITYEDDAITASITYESEYKVRPFSQDVQHLERFLYFPVQSLIATEVILDLGSLSIQTEAQVRHLVVPCYRISRSPEVSLDYLLEMMESFPERDYSDRYPLDCIRCGEPTAAATYGFKHPTTVYHQISLGGSYCIRCRIRFSYTRKEWACADLTVEGAICNTIIPFPFVCEATHLEIDKKSLVFHEETVLLKFPYRKQIRIQWIPT